MGHAWYIDLELADVGLLIGMTGSGKSWQIDKAVSYRRARGLPTLVLDYPNADHVGPHSCRSQHSWQELVKRPELVTDDPVLSMSVTVRDREELPDAIAALQAMLRYRWVRSEKRGEPVLFIIEEAGQVPTQRKGVLFNLATLHRHAGCIPILASQFATGVDTAIRKMATLIILMHQEYPDDVRELRDWFRSDIADEAPSLMPGDRIVWRSYRGAKLYRRQAG